MNGPRIGPLAICSLTTRRKPQCPATFREDAVVPIEPGDAIILQSNIIEVAHHRTHVGSIDLGTPLLGRPLTFALWAVWHG